MMYLTISKSPGMKPGLSTLALCPTSRQTLLNKAQNTTIGKSHLLLHLITIKKSARITAEVDVVVKTSNKNPDRRCTLKTNSTINSRCLLLKVGAKKTLPMRRPIPIANNLSCTRSMPEISSSKGAMLLTKNNNNNITEIEINEVTNSSALIKGRNSRCSLKNILRKIDRQENNRANLRRSSSTIMREMTMT